MRSGQPEVRAVIQGMCDEVGGYQEATVMTGEAGLGEAAVVCVACVCMCLQTLVYKALDCYSLLG